ncbi:hypothetical protein EsH8_X_000003 [Colletotrichum jinshuiense]
MDFVSFLLLNATFFAALVIAELDSKGTVDSTQCQFSDYQKYVNHIVDNKGDFNVSELVETCGSICPLIFGVGNPDVSGVGAMISYAIQGVSVILASAVVQAIRLYLDLNLRTAKPSDKAYISTKLTQIESLVEQSITDIKNLPLKAKIQNADRLHPLTLLMSETIKITGNALDEAQPLDTDRIVGNLDKIYTNFIDATNQIITFDLEAQPQYAAELRSLSLRRKELEKYVNESVNKARQLSSYCPPSLIIRSLLQICESIHQISISLSLTIMVATLVRIYQEDVLYAELTILVGLSRYQLYISFFSLHFFLIYPDTSPGWRLRLLLPSAQMLCAWAMLLAITCAAVGRLQQETTLHASILNELSSTCVEMRGFPSISTVFEFLQSSPHSTTPLNHIFSDNSYAALLEFILFPLVFWILYVWIFAKSSTKERMLSISMALARLDMTETAKYSHIAALVALHISVTFRSISDVWSTRNDLIKAHQLSGMPEDDENRWGFGQVAAVLMWTPPARLIFTAAWKIIQERL